MNVFRSLTKAVIPSEARQAIRDSRVFQLGAHLFADRNHLYDSAYYDFVEGLAIDSAPAMAASMREEFNAGSVVDVGCGTGALLEAFGAQGCQIGGLEYSEAGLAHCARRKLPVQKFDIENDPPPSKRYDLAVSFEVAEHLAPWKANRFVALLTSLAPTVVISAAIPGQAGLDHVNCQPRSYWIKKFSDRGFSYDEKAAAKLGRLWQEKRVTEFYSDNVMVFRRTAPAA